MANNKRVFYAIRKAGIAPIGSTNYATIHGLQSCNITTTFNLEQVFELGQLAIYENIEGIPDVQITLEKILDGWPPILTLATQGATAATLVGRSTAKCIFALSIYPDTQTFSVGNAQTEAHMSGVYISSFGYQASVDGNATESATLVGNNKIWVGTAGETSGTYNDGTHWDGTSSISNNSDQPYSISTSGGVSRREDVIFGYGANTTLLPADIPGTTGSGFNMLDSDGNYLVHVQGINISCDLGREAMYELGRKGVYCRYVNFPVQITSEFRVTSVSGDMISGTEAGILANGSNLTDRYVRLVLREGLKVDCGSKNKLASVGMSGADAKGGNEEITYTYNTFNDCTVQHPQDPTVALRP